MTKMAEDVVERSVFHDEDDDRVDVGLELVRGHRDPPLQPV
jgi:hypothetical protein